MDELVIRSEQDVARFVSQRPASRSSWLIVLVALGDAYDFSSLGIGIPQLKAQLHLSPLQVGSVTAMMSVGGFIGAMWGGYWTDKVGRYKMFLLDLVVLIVAALGAAVSVNIWMLLFFRFLLGAGVGLDFPVALSFIAEYVNKKKVGAVNVWQPTWYIAASFMGIVLLPFYYWANLGDHLWRIAVGFGAVPAFIILILRYKYMDESPLWAAQNLGLEKAGQILAKTYGVKVTVIPEVKPALPKPKINMGELFDRKYRKRLLLISILGFVGATEYYVVGFNLPSISMRLFGNDFLYAILGAIFFNIFGMIGGFSAVWNTTRLGTWKMTVIGLTLVCISAVSFWLGGSKLPIPIQVLLVGTFIIGHSFGPAANSNTMAALGFPTRMRGMAVGWSHSMIRVGSIVGFFFFPLVMARVGLQKMMLWVGLFPLIGLITTLCIHWEPVGVDVEQEDATNRVQAAASASGAKS
jgi:MFS family permease